MANQSHRSAKVEALPPARLEYFFLNTYIIKCYNFGLMRYRYMVKALLLLSVSSALFLCGCQGGPWGPLEYSSVYSDSVSWSPSGEAVCFVKHTSIYREGQPTTFLGGNAGETRLDKEYIYSLDFNTNQLRKICPGDTSDILYWRENHIFIKSWSGGIEYVSAEGGERRPLATDASFYFSALSPFSSEALYLAPNKIYLVKPGNSAQLILDGSTLPTTEAIGHFFWTKDVGKICFETNSTTWEINSDGSGLGQLTKEADGYYKMDEVSPDGGSIIYRPEWGSQDPYNLYLTAYTSGVKPSGGRNLTAGFSDQEWGLYEK